MTPIGFGIWIGRKGTLEISLRNKLCFVEYFVSGSETKSVLVGFPSVT